MCSRSDDVCIFNRIFEHSGSDQAGSGRAPLTPLAADMQRSALKLINDNLFAADGFNIKPEFASRLVESALERGFTPPLDRSLDATLLGLQTATMDRLLSPRVAERLQNARNKVANGTPVLGLDELYGSLTRAVWGDGYEALARLLLRVVADTTPARRALQREHARRLATIITRPGVGTAAGDARALHRLTAKTLLARAQQAKGNSKLGNQTRAHLDEIIDTLDAALKAQAARTVG